MTTSEDQKTINTLQANWMWAPGWVDGPQGTNTAGRIVRFARRFHLSDKPAKALLHFTADTRYKLIVNGRRVAVGPARSSILIWYYDTLDIAPHLVAGDNELTFVVLRYFSASRTAMPFARTPFPGLSVIGSVDGALDVGSRSGWKVQVDDSVQYPVGLIDDGFLHITERIAPRTPNPVTDPSPFGFRTANGELAPWRLRPRQIPVPEETPVSISTIRAIGSTATKASWEKTLSGQGPVVLPAGSSHRLEIQADVHSTAFLHWELKAHGAKSRVKIVTTYSEGYELEPRAYPFFRRKADRLDADNGRLIGPHDEVELELEANKVLHHEPFWFRTFRIMRLEISTTETVELRSLTATQVNYPMGVKATWSDASDKDSDKIWDISIRTMRNCMFDGYSDCPFYEQLQYAGDSRSVGLFHYLLSGDDRLMRQAITNFGASVTNEGLPQSRFPSHVPQIIAGFALYWVMEVCDHHLFFGDAAYARSFLPRIDGVFEFYNTYIDDLGLVSGLPEDVWQYVDWVTTWGETGDHPDKGVPTSGRKSNRHTYFSMLYAYTLKRAAGLVRALGRPAYAAEYEARAQALDKAIYQHCYDGRFFTDSTADIADSLAYSQHCQVFGVLSGAAPASERARLLTESFSADKQPRAFSKCSYVMMFYALRAFAAAGDDVYEAFWPRAWDPWRRMIANNMSTWEEDDVRQRSDCHAWGSVPIHEYCTELAGIQPAAPGAAKLLFKPRLGLSSSIDSKIALGKDNMAAVKWTTLPDGTKQVSLHLDKAIPVTSVLPGGKETDHGVIGHLSLVYTPGI